MKEENITFITKRIFILVLISFLGIALIGETSHLLLKRDTQTIVENLNSMIPPLLKKARIPGLQIALIRDGKIVWQKGFGVKIAGSRNSVNTETIFEAASLTKPFFAYTVMKLVDEKVIDLDTPIVKYLSKELIEKQLGHPLDEPEFHREWLEKITPRHVLSHSSGMPHGEGGKTYPIFFAPGTKYKYSAAGYYFLQRAVEKLKGEKLETIIKKYVIDPLGMKHSSMVWREDYEKSLANGHNYFGKPDELRKRTKANAAASLYTTAGDYARFVRAVMAGEGLKKETYQMMLTPQIDVDKEKGLTWSLGFGLQKDENGKAFWQWGDYGIFRNYIIAYPQAKLAVVYFTNSYYGLSICPDIISASIGGKALGNAFLGYEHYDYPGYTFLHAIYDEGPKAIEKLYPNLKAKYPKVLKPERISSIAHAFLQEKRYEEAIALYRLNIQESPQSAEAYTQLARAYAQKRDMPKAKSNYQKAMQINNDKKADNKTIQWDLAYIKALEKPVELPEEYMKKLAGTYETRHIKFENGSLYYFREGTSQNDYFKMIPMTKDTFIIEGIIYFRLKFAFNEQGQPSKVIGLYDSGKENPSIKTK